MKPRNIKRLVFRLLFAVIAPQVLDLVWHTVLAIASEGDFMAFVWMVNWTFQTMFLKSVIYSLVFEFVVARQLRPTTWDTRLFYVAISAGYWAAVQAVHSTEFSTLIPAAVTGAVCGIYLLYAQNTKLDTSKEPPEEIMNCPTMYLSLLCPLLMVLCGLYLYQAGPHDVEEPVHVMAGLVDCTYFPDQVYGEFRISWYTRDLKNLKEPSVYKQRSDAAKRIYRFTWLRSFNPPVSIRLEIKKDGRGLLVSKMVAGPVWYNPYRRLISEKQRLSKDKVARMLELIERENFWTLETHAGDSGMDGARWIVEGLDKQKYHIVDRWSPQDGPIRKIGLQFIDLCPINIGEVY